VSSGGSSSADTGGAEPALGGTTNAAGSSASGGTASSEAGSGGQPSGSGGVAGAGGAGGSGAIAIVDPSSACFGQTLVPAALLADCEGGMKGWFGYVGNSSLAVSEVHPGADSSATAADFQGGQASSSGMGISLFCDDVSSYAGISFWAKGQGGEHLRFLVAIPATDAKAGRGDCDPAKVKCNDHPGKAFDLKAEWTQYTVTWDELEQYGWGEPATFAGIANSLLWINDGPVDSFDFAVDEVELVPGRSPSL
jgi:hypothetical protein